MRRSSLKVLIAGVVTALAVPATLAATSAPAGAASTCTSTQAPVAEGAQAAFTIGCTTPNADLAGASNPQIFDYDNARWHGNGVRAYQACSWSPASTTVNCGVASANGGNPAMNVGTINHAVTGGGAKDGISAGSFVVSAPSSTSVVLSELPSTTKSGTGKLWIEQTVARNLKGVNTTNGSPAITITNPSGGVGANFNSSDIGMSIDSTCIQKGTVILAVPAPTATTATMSKNADCTQAAKDGSLGSDEEGGQARMISDLQVTASNATVTSLSANFTPDDVGLGIKCSCLQTNSYISVYHSATSVDVSPNPGSTKFTKDPIATTVTGTANGSAQIGLPGLEAPKDGDMASALLTQIKLDPGFVSGSRACAANEPAAFTLAGTWHNPGKFSKMNFLTVPLPDVTNAIGQIVYTTSVTTFAAYVIQGANGAAQIILPFVPLAIANCSGADVAAAYSFVGSSNSQGLNPTAVGRPGTGAVRGIRGLDSAGTPHTDSAGLDNNAYTAEKQTLQIGAGQTGTYTLNVDCNGDGTLDGTSLAIKNTDIAKNVTKAIRAGAPNCALKVFVTGTGGATADTGKCQSPDICTLTYNTDPGLGSGNGFTFLFGRDDLKGDNVGQITAGGFTGTISAPTIATTVVGGTVAHTATGSSCTVNRPATFGFPCGLG
jgi:hypothetical protein